MINVPLLFGPYGAGALKYVDHLAESGANALWFHEFNPEAFERCARHGIAACVEFKTFRADFRTYPELAPIGVDGQPVRYGRLVQGICLSEDWFLQEIEQRLVDGVRVWRPAGIWLDYLTYAGWFETPEPDLQESCFCPNCIADFCESAGVDAETPGEILGGHAAAWTRHKCERVARLAARYAELIRCARPDCVIGAYMCPWTPDEFDGALSRIFAQDYALLAPAIDVFTPLIYVKKSGRSTGWGQEFLERSAEFVPANRRTQLILDVFDFPASLLATARSSAPSWGIQVFGGEHVFAAVEGRQTFAQAVQQIRHTIGCDYSERSG